MYSYVKLLIISGLAVSAQDFSDHHVKRFYSGLGNKIAAVRSKYVVREETGTAFFLCKSGHFVTAESVCPDGSSDIRVYLSSGRELEGKILRNFSDIGVTILDIKNEEEIKFGRFEPSKKKVDPGLITYIPGNSNNSLVNDLVISSSRGYVTGAYALEESLLGSKYKGMVFETTSASDWHLRGAPVLDREGKLLGICTINFHPARFLTSAIPVSNLQRLFLYHESLHKENDDENITKHTTYSDTPLGFSVIEKDGALYVNEVEKRSEARRSGIEKGYKLVRIGSVPVNSISKYNDIVKELGKGIIEVAFEIDGMVFDIRLRIR